MTFNGVTAWHFQENVKKKVSVVSEVKCQSWDILDIQLIIEDWILWLNEALS